MGMRRKFQSPYRADLKTASNSQQRCLECTFLYLCYLAESSPYCFTLVRNFYRLRDWSKGINSLRSGWTYVWQLCAFKVSDKRQKVHRSVGEVGTGLGILKVHPCEVHMQPAWRITWPDLHLLFWFITLSMGPATSWNLWCLLKTERRTPQGYKRLP